MKSRDFKLNPNNQQREQEKEEQQEQEQQQQSYYTHSRYEKMVRDEKELDKFLKYTIYLGNKIRMHGYQAEIGEFIHLINFNEFYKE